MDKGEKGRKKEEGGGGGGGGVGTVRVQLLQYPCSFVVGWLLNEGIES